MMCLLTVSAFQLRSCPRLPDYEVNRLTVLSIPTCDQKSISIFVSFTLLCIAQFLSFSAASDWGQENRQSLRLFTV